MIICVFSLPYIEAPRSPCRQSSTARGRQRLLLGRLGCLRDRLCRLVLVCALISARKIAGILLRPPLAPRDTQEDADSRNPARLARSLEGQLPWLEPRKRSTAVRGERHRSGLGVYVEQAAVMGLLSVRLAAL